MQEFTRQQNPKFLAFKEEAARALAVTPTLTRLDCLNPVKAVSHTFDTSPVGIGADAAWEAYLGHSVEHRIHTRGVRDSLFVLFEWLAAHGRSVAMPSDVYPVYRQIADKAGIRFTTYPTLPLFNITSALASAADDCLLLTAPLSPLGRDLTDTEVTILEEWLGEHPERFLILDRVYDYGGGTDLRRLIATNQVAVCWSLSKSFLSPLVMGFTAVPRQLTHLHGQEPQLEEAAAILTRHCDFPAEQTSIFRYRWQKLTPLLSSLDPNWLPPRTGYLSVLRVPHSDLLARGILAVPGPIYEADDEISVVSCLHETVAFDDLKTVIRFHATVLSNFARGYDKYARTYDKNGIPESRFPNQFYLLKEADLGIGIARANQLRDKLGGGRIIVLRTCVTNHALQPNERTGLGDWVPGSRIEVDGVYDERLNPLEIEDVYADSLEAHGGLRPWSSVVPRSLSVLPIASACQAKCAFCFSHSSVSLDQTQGLLTIPRVAEMSARAAAAGASRFVITGGGEPTLLASGKLLDLIRVGARHFSKVVLITNGMLLGNSSEEERVRTLREYRDAGLDVLSVSRHDADHNFAIMGVETCSERIATSIRDVEGLTLRWVCVLQKQGVGNEARLRRYLDWVTETGADEVCFKELYVAVSKESIYSHTDYNSWSREQQVPMSLVTRFLEQQGAAPHGKLPWGAPIYRLLWKGRSIRVAVYTEPSVFWERSHGICRSWNLMADGRCLANLETASSLVV
ncbi:aminotransferase class I/II-fold pyridoxal phosphate-dependent enzyme [Schlesneria sp. T3-172]|uniref:aminotransferase class I/II-fold pyridoxal phosphate-dependent enzyme n=1 Tax=Schlesneria sphaerica TaxID=3373610 RepID=UPI0037C8F792